MENSEAMPAKDGVAPGAELTGDDAEALLEALGSSLNWVKSRSGHFVKAGIPPGAKEYFLLGFVAEETGGDARHRFVVRDCRTTGHWVASVFPQRRRTQIRGWRKTRAEAKAACEHYLETGNWENVEPEASLEWTARAPWESLAARERLLYRAIGRNIQYRLMERRWLRFFRRYFIVCDTHQCAIVEKRLITREVDFAPPGLPDCMGKIETRLFWSIAAAKVACERHHTTGKWD